MFLAQLAVYLPCFLKISNSNALVTICIKWEPENPCNRTFDLTCDILILHRFANSAFSWSEGYGFWRCSWNQFWRMSVVFLSKLRRFRLQKSQFGRQTVELNFLRSISTDQTPQRYRLVFCSLSQFILIPVWLKSQNSRQTITFWFALRVACYSGTLRVWISVSADSDWCCATLLSSWLLMILTLLNVLELFRRSQSSFFMLLNRQLFHHCSPLLFDFPAKYQNLGCSVSTKTHSCRFKSFLDCFTGIAEILEASWFVSVDYERIRFGFIAHKSSPEEMKLPLILIHLSVPNEDCRSLTRLSVTITTSSFNLFPFSCRKQVYLDCFLNFPTIFNLLRALARN